MPYYKYVCNKTQGKFLTSQAEYLQSYECLGSCLVLTEHLMMKMKSSKILVCGPPCVHLVYT